MISYCPIKTFETIIVSKGKIIKTIIFWFWEKPPTGSIDIRSEADFSKSA